ncbi:MAG: SCO family protein [Piscirickettsiaceae bacterium]|nr:SCO family protein [Piscirickettsiaceae bacterium]
MAKRCKDLNSKCFLFTYLIIVSFLLVLWINRLPLMQEDLRDIPTDMLSYIESPAKKLPPFSLITSNKLALTNEWLNNKWTFVYFSHSHCLPQCQPALEKMNYLRSAFANNNLQFLVIGLDNEHEAADALSQFLMTQQLKLTAATASEPEIESLAKAFIALYLTTNFTDGSYQIEQEHHIFLVDPKGRIYATFRPPYSNTSIQSRFLKLRQFYAQSE